MPVATVRALPLFSLISPRDGICISHLSAQVEAPHHLPNTFRDQIHTTTSPHGSLSPTAFSQCTAILINNFPHILLHILYRKSPRFSQSRNTSRDRLQYIRNATAIDAFLPNHTYTKNHKTKKPQNFLVKEIKFCSNLQEIFQCFLSLMSCF